MGPAAGAEVEMVGVPAGVVSVAAARVAAAVRKDSKVRRT